MEGYRAIDIILGRVPDVGYAAYWRAVTRVLDAPPAREWAVMTGDLLRDKALYLEASGNTGGR